MKVAFWGTRGSIATPGPETDRHGGNTACVEVRGDRGALLVLDAGTGIRRLGETLAPAVRRVHILLTHLHMDHIQGLGFFGPLYNPKAEVHIWGPASASLTLRQRITRYLSPPLFPVRLRDLPCALHFHEVPQKREMVVEDLRIDTAFVCHPNPTVGYRITSPRAVLAYIPDHEPALGVGSFPLSADWTSGTSLAADADMLIHDAQYTSAEYPNHVGWGHSTHKQAFAFATLARARHLVLFHHDPAHSDDDLELQIAKAVLASKPEYPVTAAREGTVFNLG